MESLEEIRKMLERFYQGETTLEEEKMLQDYFSSTSVPEELIPDKELFRNLGADAEEIQVPLDLNQKIITSLDKVEKKAVRTRRISLFSLSGLAAGLLALVAVYLFILRDDTISRYAAVEWADTYEDPMDAYEEAKRTLAFVSAKLNNGTSELKQVQKQVGKTAEPIRSLSKLNKGSKELSLLGQLQRVREIDR
jgi:hypothetical protein